MISGAFGSIPTAESFVRSRRLKNGDAAKLVIPFLNSSQINPHNQIPRKFLHRQRRIENVWDWNRELS